MKNRAMIFDIEHGSFVDGPGIRTTVFFKGCNLRCMWCHNPESQERKVQKLFYADKCIWCGACKKACTHPDECILCGKCEIVCPKNAISIKGKEISANEIMDEILMDKPFYGDDGGVTFSGGECMLQIDFLAEILRKCKEENIHTAVDTAGNVSWECFKKIIDYTDLFLYDIKLANSEKHKKYTGVTNELIIDNLKKLSAAGKDIIIRIPVIGGVNDNIDEMHQIKNILKDINVIDIELLPYHAMGENKYLAMNKELIKFGVPDEKQMKEFERRKR